MSTPMRRTSLAPLMALIATLLLAGLLGGPASAAYPGANGKIAYESNDGVDSEIFVMNADGSAQTNLTNDAESVNDRNPAWSPNGAKIAFARASEGHINIYVMNGDGSAQVNLTPGPETSGEANGGVDPTWSPDGTKIAYNHSGDIWVMDAASGAGKVKLDFGPGLETWPAWSPDGTKMAFIRGFDVWVANAGGGVATQLTTTTGAEKGPDWSPNGLDIVYERGGQIWSMNADGSGQTAFTAGAGQCGTLPAWSPDGTKIVFDSSCFTAPNGYDIFVMNADGTNETRIDTGTDADLDPSWQPVAVPGGYPRPGGATPLRVSLVPAYRQCAAANRTHGAPLAFASCNPPMLESSQLTVGTPDANGAGAASTGFAKFSVAAGVPGGVDDSDVRFTFSLTDVRHQGGTLPDYTGELQATTTVRITDRVGGPASEAATVTDVAFPVTVPCTATSTAPGATCAVTTSFDAVVPGTVPEGKRTIWQLEQVRVQDGGPDGDVDTTPNTLFAVQGVFVP
jgi:hypothetical protein